MCVLEVIWCFLWDLPFFENGARGGRHLRNETILLFSLGWQKPHGTFYST